MSRLKVEMNRYEKLELDLEWEDENGAAIDITGREFAIKESKPAMLGDFVISDGPAGKVRLTIEDTNAFAVGDGNWLRVAMTLPDESLDTTPPIWIEVT